MRPIIVGMNNPLSTRAGHELYPAPEGCSGHRLWSMLHVRTGASRQSYMNTFERRNLVRDVTWDRRAARARASEIVAELRDSGRTVVLLGQSVREAFDRALQEKRTERVGMIEWAAEPLGGLPPLLVHPQVVAGCTWRQVPHPSGRNLWYDSAENRRVVEMLMEELYVEYQKQQEMTS